MPDSDSEGRGFKSPRAGQKSESFSFRIFYLRRRYTITLKEKRKTQTDVIIQTERLTLREMTHDDYDILYAVLSDSDIMRHYPYTFDEKRVRGWIDRNRQRYNDFGFGLWAVCLAENGVMIGDCGLTMQNINGTILPEIGYHIAKIHQNKGYATEAARAVRDWTFTVTPFRSLYSYMKKENLPSAAVARANGMTLTDEFTDDKGERSLVYQITRTEWLKNN